MKTYLDDQNITYTAITVTFSYTSNVLIDFLVEVPSVSVKEISALQTVVNSVERSNLFSGFEIVAAQISVFQVTS